MCMHAIQKVKSGEVLFLIFFKKICLLKVNNQDNQKKSMVMSTMEKITVKFDVVQFMTK